MPSQHKDRHHNAAKTLRSCGSKPHVCRSCQSRNEPQAWENRRLRTPVCVPKYRNTRTRLQNASLEPDDEKIYKNYKGASSLCHIIFSNKPMWGLGSLVAQVQRKSMLWDQKTLDGSVFARTKMLRKKQTADERIHQFAEFPSEWDINTVFCTDNRITVPGVRRQDVKKRTVKPNVKEWDTVSPWQSREKRLRSNVLLGRAEKNIWSSEHCF